MARPQNPDLTKYWKICLPATLAGTVEFYLFDRLHGKPKYGTRGKLLTSLLTEWVVLQKDPDARAKAVFSEVIPAVRDMKSEGEILEAIKRGLEVELTPSSSVPPSIASLA